MPAPPDPNLCPGHKALEAMIQDMRTQRDEDLTRAGRQRDEDKATLAKQRDEDKAELKGYIDGAVVNITGAFERTTERIEKRLDKGDAKLQQYNGDITTLKGKDRYLAGGLALVVFLAPLIIALIALFKG